MTDHSEGRVVGEKDALLIVPRADLRAIHEALCIAQAAVLWTYNGIEEADKPSVIARLGQIIEEIDRGSSPTTAPTCGCEDQL